MSQPRHGDLPQLVQGGKAGAACGPEAIIFEACLFLDQRRNICDWLPALAAQQGQQGTTGAKQPRENSSADGLPSKRAKPTRRGGRGRGQSLPQEQIGNVVTMQQEDALNRIRLETSHTLHLAQQGQGAVLKALYNAAPRGKSRRTVASQYRPSEWSSLGCFWPKLRPGSNCSPKTMQQ